MVGISRFRGVGCRMTHGKVRGCHMAPQRCDTSHKKEWLTLSHMGGMIPWLILSHVSDDVIKKDYEIKEKEEKGKATHLA